MDNPQHKAFDQELAASLSRGRSVAVTGFADRVVGAIRTDRRRRVVTTGASCALEVMGR